MCTRISPFGRRFEPPLLARTLFTHDGAGHGQEAPAAEPVIELLEAPESARAAGLVVRGAIASG